MLILFSKREEDRVALHIMLYQPQIPPNTGNVIRLVANCGAALHLIEPLGFELSQKQLRRAGLDYHDASRLFTWSSLEEYIATHPNRRIVAVETSGSERYTDFSFQPQDTLLFGSETLGLPTEVLDRIPKTHQVFIPMMPDNRSLNLSNSLAVVTFEAWRQLDFVGIIPTER